MKEKMSVENMKICPSCQREQKAENNFCVQCGYNFLTNEQVVPDQGKLEQEDAAQEKDEFYSAPTVVASGESSRGASRSRVRKNAKVSGPPHPSWAIRYEINEREENEDSFLFYELFIPTSQEKLRILAVADGMGGHVHGEDISRHVLYTINELLFEQFVLTPNLNVLQPSFALNDKTVGNILWQALEVTNARLRKLVQANGWGKAGSTIVIALIWGDILIVANLGDSPLFLYKSQSGKLEKMTEDHTVAGALVRQNMLSPEMARFHEGRSRLEFHVGSERLPKERPVRKCTLTPGDLVLLCSDGISGALTAEQLEKTFRSAQENLETLADNLIQNSLETGETDNQTLLLWRYNPAH